MRTKKTMVIETNYIEYKCDFCNYTTVENSIYNISVCDICGKDCCPSHTKLFMEDPKNWDWPDLTTCLECADKGKKAFEWAKETADRHEILSDVIERYFTMERANMELE